MNLSDEEVPLEGQGLVLVVGKNGMGKSSMFVEGPYYALYGLSFKYKSPVGDKVVNEHAPDEEDSYVSLWLDVDGTEYQIVRSRKSKEYPPPLSVYSNGRDLSRGTAADTQEFINNLVGMGPSAFSHSVVFSSKILKFPTLKDSEKKEIFDEILQLEVLNQGLEETKKAIKALKEEKSGLNERKKFLTENIKTLEEDCINTKKDMKLWEMGRSDRLSALKSEYNRIDKEVEELSKKRDTLISKIDENKTKLDRKKGKYDKIESLISEEERSYYKLCSDHSSRYAAFCNSLEKEKSEKERISKLISSGHCSVCFQKTPESVFSDTLDKIESKIKDITAKTKGCLDEKKELDGTQKEIEEAKKQLSESKGEIRDLERLVLKLNEEAEGFSDTLSDKKAEKRGVETKLSTEASSENPHKVKSEGLEAQVLKAEKDLEEVAKGISSVSEKIADEEVIETVLGSKGARLHLIQSALPLLNAEAEKTQLLMNTHLSVKFKLKSSEEAYGGNLVTEVFNPKGAKHYEGDSQGEQACVDWILLLSLLALVSSRGKKSVNQALYDEVFDALDEANEAGVLNVLKQVATTKSSVFILSHSADEIGGQCDRVWTVENGKLLKDCA